MEDEIWHTSLFNLRFHTHCSFHPQLISHSKTFVPKNHSHLCCVSSSCICCHNDHALSYEALQALEMQSMMVSCH